MNLTKTCFGNWSGGRFMHFGEMVSEERYLELIRRSFEKGIRTFITADVYGGGRADELLGKALADFPREDYCLVGAIGHDFYEGERQGSAGYPRFTDPALRSARDYRGFMNMACEKSLERCGVNHFDMLMLHNPGEIGYTSEAVWEGMRSLKDEGLIQRIGIAPGPANGFTLDLLHTFENFGEVLDWAMIILNPLEPWPGQQVLAGAIEHEVQILTRVIDYGGVFHGEMKPGHEFRPGDHRAYRPDGWVERGCEKLEAMRGLAEKYGLSMIQFAAIWNLSQKPVASVVPTFIQEAGADARPIEDQVDDLAAMPEDIVFTAEEVAMIQKIGDNTGCMTLKGASKRHAGPCERPDEWPMRPELLATAEAFGVGQDW